MSFFCDSPDTFPRHRYRYNCGDRTCGASDCGCCRNGPAPWEEDDGYDELECDHKSKVVTARKDRPERGIRKGDKVLVVSFYTYLRGGPRTGYHREYKRLAKGPAWAQP